ncbi:MAG: PAS domain-containing protein [Actinobacteria bacterium]|nr:PAS domain-containing protein [Actinomycetota bacterium]
MTEGTSFTLAYSIVLLVRLVGAAVALDLYLRFRGSRFLLLLAGWLVYSLSVLVVLVWRTSPVAQFVYAFTAALALYLFLEVVLAFFDKDDRRRLVIVPPALLVLFLALWAAIGDGYGLAAPAIQTLLLVGGGAIALSNHRRSREVMGASLYWLVALFVIGAFHAIGYVFVYRLVSEAGAAPMAVTAMLGVVGVVFFIHLEHGVVLRRQTAATEHLSSFMAGLDAIILESDATAIYRVAGQTERILGYSVDDWFAHEGGAFGFWCDHIHPDDRAATVAESDRNLRAGLDHTLEYRMLAAGGRVVWLRDYVTVETASDGAVLERDRSWLMSRSRSAPRRSWQRARPDFAPSSTPRLTTSSCWIERGGIGTPTSG